MNYVGNFSSSCSSSQLVLFSLYICIDIIEDVEEISEQNQYTPITHLLMRARRAITNFSAIVSRATILSDVCTICSCISVELEVSLYKLYGKEEIWIMSLKSKIRSVQRERDTRERAFIYGNVNIDA